MSEVAARDCHVEVETWLFAEDRVVPNNPTLPLLVYREAVALTGRDPGSNFETLFTANNWPAAWRYGVFPFHHFHSNAHETLGVFQGSATVRFGGESGTDLSVRAGDVVVIPAGVGHKALSASPDFAVVGAYPTGTRADLQHGTSERRESWLEAIAQVPLPELDPVCGADGPLQRHWHGPTAT